MPTAARPSLTDTDIDTLQSLLDAVPAPLEPLDASSLDGFLCGVLVQPKSVPVARWLAHVTDVDGRALPARFDATALHALAKRRHAELGAAIAGRQWFDPWVFELEGEDDEPSEVDAVYPWVAGFATAVELFPELMQRDAQSLTEHTGHLSAHIAFLLDAALGLINIEQNGIIKFFSVVAVVFMPPTLIASIYGMNFDVLPELHYKLGYPLALVAMLIAAILPYVWFKRRGWL
jgi:yecA family protein